MRPMDSANSDAGWGKVPHVKVPLDGSVPPATSSSASATQQAQAQGAADQASATADTLNPPPFYASMVDQGGIVSQPWAFWFNKFWVANGGASPSILSLQVQEAYDAIPAPVRHPDQFDYPQPQREAQAVIDYEALASQVARLRESVEGLEVATAFPPPRQPIPASSGGGAAVIQEIVVTTPVSSVSFAAIPQTFKSLKLLVTGRATGTTTDVGMDISLNGDTTTNNYYGQLHGILGPYNYIDTRYGPTIGNCDGNGFTSHFVVDIPHYADGTFSKAIFSRNITTVTDWVSGIGGNDSRAMSWDVRWNDVTAITSIDLTLSVVGANFDTGTIFTLIGE